MTSKKSSPSKAGSESTKSSARQASEKAIAKAKGMMATDRGKMIAAALGAATAAAAGIVAFKTARGKSRAVFHLMPHENGWQVKRTGKSKPEMVHEKKRAARDKAREFARNHEPSQLVVHRTDGTIQTVHTYGE